MVVSTGRDGVCVGKVNTENKQCPNIGDSRMICR